MEGMRYERGGKGKYWILKPGEVNSRTPLLGNPPVPRNAATMTSAREGIQRYDDRDPEVNQESLDPEDEALFADAKALEFGDWNVGSQYQLLMAALLTHVLVSGNHCPRPVI